MTKPGILCLSQEDDEVFKWASDGWNQIAVRDTDEAKRLFALAKKCIGDAENQKDAIERLKSVGFEVEV